MEAMTNVYKITEKEPMTKDGDGDDGGESDLEVLMIRPVDNGWILNTEGEETIIEVFELNNEKGLLKAIIESLGLSIKLEEK